VTPKQQQNQKSDIATQTIQEDQWVPFLDQFTRENRGTHARLEILGPDLGSQMEAEDRPFDGVSADNKAGERNVSILFGSSAEDHFEHGIQNVTAIRLRAAGGESGPTLEIVSKDGTKALLELSQPEAYELPPAGR
jgi:hypothetical protein